MPIPYTPPHLPSSAGRSEYTIPGGIVQHAEVPGERSFYPAEVTAAAADGVLTLSEPVRTVVFLATQPVFVARSAAALGTVADGTVDGRVYMPAGMAVELPWHQDEIHFKRAGGTDAALYIRGMI